MEYAYFVASLPSLKLGDPPPFDGDELIRASAGVLQEADHAQLQALMGGRTGEVVEPATRRVLDAETQLRNALARQRAAKAGVDAGPWVRRHDTVDGRVDQAAARAMAEPDPLQRELLLDRHRWRLLDELSALPSFGVQAVFAYALQLRLVEKWHGLSDEEGLALAQSVVGDAVAEVAV